MFRRNPDAIALLAIGLVFLGLNAPRLMLHESNWRVTPLKMQLQGEPQEVRMIQRELFAHREEIRRAAESIRESVRP